MTVRSSTLMVFALAACGGASAGTSDAQVPDEPHGEPQLVEAGTLVCFTAVLPMRYVLEDALTAHELELVDSCVTAEIQVEEQGEPGKYVLRYQRVGDEKWQSCASTSEDRIAFLQTCTDEMMATMGTEPATE